MTVPYNAYRGPGNRAQARLLKGAGFTLLEMLIALALLAIVSLLSWHGLNAVTSGTARVSAPLNYSLNLGRAFAQLKVDGAALAAPDEIGIQPLQFELNGLTLVRRSSSLSDGPAYQVVRYTLIGRQLWRSVSQPVQDSSTLLTMLHKHAKTGAELQNRDTAVLLVDQVAALKLRLKIPGKGWTSDDRIIESSYRQALLPGSFTNHRPDLRPTGVELSLFYAGVPNPITRLIKLGP